MIVVDHTDMKVRGWVGSVDINDDSVLAMWIWSMRSDRRDRC
jgi:membrane carboxypeptidase/penicillin-binding protein PbpC